MKYGVYCVKDKLAAFNTPFYAENDSVAERQFIDAINIKESVMYNHKQDFDLMKIGVYDSTTGFLDCMNDPELLLHGESVVLRDL